MKNNYILIHSPVYTKREIKHCSSVCAVFLVAFFSLLDKCPRKTNYERSTSSLILHYRIRRNNFFYSLSIYLGVVVEYFALKHLTEPKLKVIFFYSLHIIPLHSLFIHINFFSLLLLYSKA